jgi:RNA polymerase sigma-70 factor (ECF subfamily)
LLAAFPAARGRLGAILLGLGALVALGGAGLASSPAPDRDAQPALSVVGALADPSHPATAPRVSSNPWPARGRGLDLRDRVALVDAPSRVGPRAREPSSFEGERDHPLGTPLVLAAIASASGNGAADADGDEAVASGRRAALTRAMDRHAEGDAAAFAEVYDLLGPRLFAFFVRRTRDRAKAEDLVQQTLMQMHCARQSYVRGSDVVPWAFAIGRRLLIDTYRRGKHEVLFDSAEDGAGASDGRVSRDSIPEEVASTRQIAERVQESLDALPEAQRTDYVLVREEGLSVAEAAQVMGITATALKLRAHRVYEHTPRRDGPPRQRQGQAPGLISRIQAARGFGNVSRRRA